MFVPSMFTCVQGLFVPVEIHHQLFVLPDIVLKVVLLAPFYKILNGLSVCSVIPVPDEANVSRVGSNFCRRL